MISSNALYLGTANPMNLLTDPNDGLPEGGWELIRAAKDADEDGVADIDEYGPDGNDTDFDGNDDGIPDSEQSDVISINTKSERYLTIDLTDNPSISSTICTKDGR